MPNQSRRPFRSFGLCVELSIGVLLATGSALARPLFPNPVFDAGNNPSEVQLVDVNRDGIRDQIVTDSGQDQGGPQGLSVLLGHGDGSFEPALFRALPDLPQITEAADLDADGAPDLIILLGYNLNSRIVVLKGNGDGTFGAEQTVVTSALPGWFAPGDFNGDGKTDLLVPLAGGPPAMVEVLPGRGDGTFALGIRSAAPFFGGVDVADFNGDGRSDYAVSHTDRGIGIELGVGDGTFTQVGPVMLIGVASNLALADFTDDGQVDIVVGQRFSSSDFRIILYVGHGDGTFGPIGSSISTWNFPRDLVTGDVNGDGRLDIVATGDFYVMLLKSRGDGSFDVAPGFDAGDGVNDATLADLDGDARVDLVVVAGQSNASFLFFGNGDGTFGPSGQAFPPSAGPQNSALGDFNGDGIKDFAIANLWSDDVSIVLGNGDGTFGTESHNHVEPMPWGTAVGDFDRDGSLDIAVTLFDWSTISNPPVPDGNVRLLLGRGDGTFQLGGLFPIGTAPFALAVADVNGDARLDLVAANQGLVESGLYGDLSVLLGNGDGTFAAESRIAAGVAPSSVGVGDFNGDRRSDLVVADRGYYQYFGGIPGDFSLLPGNGDGTFGARIVLSQGTVPSSVTVGDLNGDGRDDLAVVDEGTSDFGGPFTPGRLTVYLGQPNGTLYTDGPVDAGFSPTDARIGDGNADGAKDILLTNNAFYMTLFAGVGDGTFRRQERYGYGQIFFIAGDDFNTDGFGDIAVGSTRGLFILTAGDGRPLVGDLRLSTTSSLGKGSGTVTWSTSREVDLRGFNVVVIGNSGRRTQQNFVLVPCSECITGLASTYTFIIPKHKNGQNVYLEAVHRDGSVTRFGPAAKN